VRAVRFNLRRGGSEGAGKLESFARRVHEVAGAEFRGHHT
jgi:hypothetical protein